MAVRIGIDTGGTHTDVVLADGASGRLVTLKVPTTPGDLADGILGGVADALAVAGEEAAAIGQFVYGTTLVTNLLVEERRIAVGLVTTEGFRDVLEIGRASRKPNVYDIHWRPAPPLIPRHLRLGVAERIDARGQVVAPLDEAAARAALARLAGAGVEAIAVCLLNAYANPAHEQRIKALAAEACPGLPVTLSSEVAREFREYERSSTTALNAYVMTPMVRHLDGLAAALAGRGIVAAPHIMRGNGGIMTFARAKALPAAVTHSGPVAGIVGGTAIARACGLADVVTFDMGGTSTDVALVRGGAPLLTARGRLGAHPVLLPMLDLVTIGAGGGSIARVDEGGALKVGPVSAGAVPGPACYGAGGEAPTVTDANLVAGRLNPGFFLAGKRRLDPALAERAIAEQVARPLGMDVADAALGILAIAEAHMANATKLVSVQRGLDPRDFALIGFGGAGPLHAVRVAEALGMRRVLVPAAPGNVSASGLLVAEIRHDLVLTRVAALDAIDPAGLDGDLAALLEEAVGVLEGEGVPPGERALLAAADLRYRGQAYELTVPVAGQRVTAETPTALARAFADAHRRHYGYELGDRPVELVSLRVTALGPPGPSPWPEAKPAQGAAEPAGRRRVAWPGDAAAEWPTYRFEALAPDHGVAGPAIVEYPGSTLVLPPGWRAAWDRFRHAHLERDAA